MLHQIERQLGILQLDTMKLMNYSFKRIDWMKMSHIFEAVIRRYSLRFRLLQDYACSYPSGMRFISNLIQFLISNNHLCTRGERYAHIIINQRNSDRFQSNIQGIPTPLLQLLELPSKHFFSHPPETFETLINFSSFIHQLFFVFPTYQWWTLNSS